MKNGIPVLDSDGHTLPPLGLWRDYLDPAYRDRVEIEDSFLVLDGSKCVLNDERTRQMIGFSDEDLKGRYGEIADRGFDAEGMLIGMDREGIDYSITYDPLFAFWDESIDPKLAAAMTRAFNRWVTDFFAVGEGRLRPSAPLPLYDVDLALQELDFAWELGIRAFWSRPNPVNGRLLGDRTYDRIYAVLEERNAPFAVHEGTGCKLPTVGYERFDTFLERHACSHPMEMQMAMLNMMVGGVFERFPKLRVGFLESGCSWLPYWLYRMDEHVEWLGKHEAPHLKAMPSDYFRRQCFITCEPDEELLPLVISAIGDDNIMFASDFPHPDCKYPHILDTFLGIPDVSEESQRKILWDNSVRFYQMADIN